MSVTGGDAIAKSLRRMEPAARRVFKSRVRADVRRFGNAMKATAKARAPKRTGRLRRAIKLRVRNVGLTFMAHLYIDYGKSKDDPSGAWYGAHINGGYTRASRTGRDPATGRFCSGRYVPGAHFMEGAYNAHAESSALGLMGSIRAAVREASRA